MRLCLRCFYLSPASRHCTHCGGKFGNWGRWCRNNHWNGDVTARFCQECGQAIPPADTVPFVPLGWVGRSLTFACLWLFGIWAYHRLDRVGEVLSTVGTLCLVTVTGKDPTIIRQYVYGLAAWLVILTIFSLLLPGETGRTVRRAERKVLLVALHGGGKLLIFTSRNLLKGLQRLVSK